MGVALGGGANNSARTVASVVGSTIRLGDTGAKIGHSGGLATLPTLLQLEIAIAQPSGHSRPFALRILSLLFELGGDLFGPCHPLALNGRDGLGVVSFDLGRLLEHDRVVPFPLGVGHRAALPDGEQAQGQNDRDEGA